jgi:hypothetical protein
MISTIVCMGDDADAAPGVHTMPMVAQAKHSSACLITGLHQPTVLAGESWNSRVHVRLMCRDQQTRACL